MPKQYVAIYFAELTFSPPILDAPFLQIKILLYENLKTTTKQAGI